MIRFDVIGILLMWPPKYVCTQFDWYKLRPGTTDSF